MAKSVETSKRARKTKTAKRPAKKSVKTSAAKSSRKKTFKKKTSPKKAKRSVKKWSGKVTQTSDALDLRHDVFKLDSPAAIARSLKSSAQRSHRRKSDPYRSAMSMLVFYINRAGKNLTARRLSKLNAAKGELRKAFGKEA